MLRHYLESHRDLFGPGSVLGYLHVNAAHIHVWAGFIALVSAVVAFSTAKGQARHKLSGRISLGGIAVVVLTAFLMFVFIALLPGYSRSAGYKPETEAYMLCLVTVAAYNFIGGYRWAANPKPYVWFDPILPLLAIGAGLLSLVSIPFDAVINPLFSTLSEFPLSPLSATLSLSIFALTSLALAWDDIRTIWFKWVSPRQRILKHVNRVSMAVVSVLTGFVVINLGPVFVAHGWEPSPLYVLPGIFVAPLIIQKVSALKV